MVTMSSTQLQMSQQEIEAYAKSFLKEAYNMELTIPIVINPYISNVLARFLHYKNHGSSIALEFSKKYLKHGQLNDILGTIKHECIHFAMYEMYRPYKDGHPEFEAELKKHGANTTETVNYKMERNVRVYKCNCREHIELRKLSNNGADYQCVDCKADLVYKERRKQLV